MLDWIRSLMESMGYFGVLLLMIVENVFPPIPSEFIMPLAGFTSARGNLNFIGVVVAGTAGSVIGGLPLFYLGKYVGEERLKQWADAHGAWLTVSADDIEKVDRWFDRHGTKAVFIGRMVPGIRSLISIPAGISGMNIGTFVVYTAAGSALWAGMLAYLGRLLGENYEMVNTYLGPIGVGVIVALVLAFVVWVWRRKRQRAETAG
jgi:membrane protein DedA with SNARE-associated domain